MYIYIYIYTYVYVCMYVCMCVCIYIYIYIYKYTSLSLYIYIHTYLSIYLSIYLSLSLYIYIYIYIYNNDLPGEGQQSRRQLDSKKAESRFRTQNNSKPHNLKFVRTLDLNFRNLRQENVNTNINNRKCQARANHKKAKTTNNNT